MTVAELAVKRGVHTTHIGAWKRRAPDGMSGRMKDWRRVATRRDRRPKVSLSAKAPSAPDLIGYAG